MNKLSHDISTRPLLGEIFPQHLLSYMWQWSFGFIKCFAKLLETSYCLRCLELSLFIITQYSPICLLFFKQRLKLIRKIVYVFLREYVYNWFLSVLLCINHWISISCVIFGWSYTIQFVIYKVVNLFYLYLKGWCMVILSPLFSLFCSIVS